MASAKVAVTKKRYPPSKTEVTIAAVSVESEVVDGRIVPLGTETDPGIRNKID